MTSTSFIRRGLAATALAVGVAATAQAQETQLFTWSGRVDRSIRLTIRGNQFLNSSENNMQTRGRFRENSALPTRDGIVRIVTESGRGQVSVVQQPASNNSYTALIDLVDNDGGADNYRITAYYTPNNGGYGNGRYDRNQNGRRDRDDRGQYGRQNGYSSPTLHWSGDVQGQVDIVWSEGSVTSRAVRGPQVRNMTSSVSNGASYPRPAQLNVVASQGNGRVEVIQQPGSSNNYVGIIRVIDQGRGFSHYALDVNWR